MNGSGCSFQQALILLGRNADKALKMAAWEAVQYADTSTWSFILLLGVWISHETISCCVVFDILCLKKFLQYWGKTWPI